MTVELKEPEIKTFKSFVSNVSKYTARRLYYLKKFPENYVAVLNGEVIAHDKKLKPLLKQVSKDEHDLTKLLIDYLSEKIKLIVYRSSSGEAEQYEGTRH